MLDILQYGDDLRARLQENTTWFRERMTGLGFEVLPGDHPIVPVMIGDAARAARLADLLLAKLQVAEVNHKDLTDTAMLLLDHRLTEHDGAGQLNAAHISEVCAGDWGLYTTVSDNLDALEHLLLDLALADQATAALGVRVGELRDRLAQAPKTRAWKLRAKIGRRKRWYETPEEVVR